MSHLEIRIQHGPSASASVSTGVTRGVKRTTARSSTTRPAHVNVEYFAKYFKDPPNANDILNRAFHSREQEGDNLQDDSQLKDEEQDLNISSLARSTGPYRKLQFYDNISNCERIFRAAHFLKDHLRDRAHLEDDEFRFHMSKDGAVFKRLATDLALAHPILNGVTSTALYSFYTTIVAKRRELDSFLRRASRNTWRHTKLSDMAWELCKIDAEIKARQQRMASVGDKQLAEAKVNDTRMPLAAATLGKRRIEEDVEDDEDYENLEDAEGAEATEDTEDTEDAGGAVDDMDDPDGLDFGECDQPFDSLSGEYPIDIDVFNNLLEAFPGPSSSTSTTPICGTFSHVPLPRPSKVRRTSMSNREMDFLQQIWQQQQDIIWMAESMEERLRQFMESMSQKVDGLDRKADVLERKVDAMQQKGDVLEGKIDGMERKVDVLEQKVAGVERMTSHMEQSYQHIATTISQGQMVFRQGIEQLRMELRHQKERLEYQGTIQHVQNSNPFQPTSGVRLPRRPPFP
ncbi:MAG: hypothetical protein J3Q66DRAFT_208102 [Benniella sp.]|nr:MAG: hypothetical protein J3Q66DRAFT_208102 [Benniella sp.]